MKHPGKILLDDLGRTTGYNLADKILIDGEPITKQYLYMILKGKRNITLNIAQELERLGYRTALEWRRMQADYDVWKRKREKK